MKIFKLVVTRTLMVLMIIGMLGMFIFTALSLDEAAMAAMGMGILSWALLIALDWDL